MKRFILLIVFVVLALFPYGLIAENSRSFARFLYTVFPEGIGHVVGHSLVFCLGGLLALWVLPRLQTRPGLYFFLILLTGIVQEILQLTHKDRFYFLDSLGDICVDLIAAGMAWIAIQIWRNKRRTLESDRSSSDSRLATPDSQS